jgi:hypothetical protein
LFLNLAVYAACEGVCYSLFMDAIAFTRELIDIESITGNEARVGEFIFRGLSRLGYQAQTMAVEEGRSNVYAVFLPRKMPSEFTGAAHAMPKGSLRHRLRQPNSFARKEFILDCFSLLERSGIVSAHK